MFDRVTLEMRPIPFKLQKCHELIQNIKEQHVSVLPAQVEEKLTELTTMLNHTDFNSLDGYHIEISIWSSSYTSVTSFLARFKEQFPWLYEEVRPITRSKLTIVKSPHGHKESRDQSLVSWYSSVLIIRDVDYLSVTKIHFYLTQTMSSAVSLRLKIC